ncbi:hypothetical protein COOONC_16289 [Cooperia oncophora]
MEETDPVQLKDGLNSSLPSFQLNNVRHFTRRNFPHSKFIPYTEVFVYYFVTTLHTVDNVGDRVVGFILAGQNSSSGKGNTRGDDSSHDDNTGIWYKRQVTTCFLHKSNRRLVGLAPVLPSSFVLCLNSLGSPTYLRGISPKIDFRSNNANAETEVWVKRREFDDAAELLVLGPRRNPSPVSTLCYKFELSK